MLIGAEFLVSELNFTFEIDAGAKSVCMRVLSSILDSVARFFQAVTRMKRLYKQVRNSTLAETSPRHHRRLSYFRRVHGCLYIRGRGSRPRGHFCQPACEVKRCQIGLLTAQGTCQSVARRQPLSWQGRVPTSADRRRREPVFGGRRAGREAGAVLAWP